MINGDGKVPEDFNHGFLTCIPKMIEDWAFEGELVVGVSNTRPILVVDAANRLLAAKLQAS
eukprot:10684792-Karenia_brevis.AAC.1